MSVSKKRYKLAIAYDGAPFNGWQYQPSSQGRSIQGELEEALSTLARSPVRLIGASRTDAGVHALGQVGHFSTEGEIDPKKWLYSLNGILPVEIRPWELIEVPETFHAQYSAVRKRYCYRLCISQVENPLLRNVRLHVPQRLNLSAMRKATNALLGEHDFLAFANESHRGCAKRNSVRTLFHLELIEKEDELCCIFEGDGFLYKMIRNIMGVLLEVGREKRSADSIQGLLLSRDRRLGAMALPAHGLTLVQVYYRDPPT